MFVKFDNSKKVSSDLVFIKSTNIKVFPCGRRKTELVDFNGDSASTSDQRYIPIDPEARLNTEANNRKHSGLNGFKQTYLNYWRITSTTKELSFVIAGYLFTIKLPDDGSLSTPQDFGARLAELLGNNIDKIYAHIKLANVAFFSSVDGANSITSSVGTEILRDQTIEDEARPCLDLFIGLDQNDNEVNELDPNIASNYFFSGLSFKASAEADKDEWVLPLLTLMKESGSWVINEACRLPEIDHGDATKSVKILGSLEVADTTDNNGEKVAGEIYAQELNVAVNGTKHPVATLDVIKVTNNTYKLSFNGAVVSNP